MSELKQNASFNKLVDRYSRYIVSPVLRLKFLNTALGIKPGNGNLLIRTLRRIPVLGTLEERARLIVEVSKYLPRERPIPFTLRLTAVLYRLRLGVYASALLVTVGAGAATVYFSAKVVAGLSVSTEAKGVTTSGGDSNDRARTAAAANTLVAVGSEAGLPPEKVWLAERSTGFEFYSNGARILTEFETDGPDRRFHRFDVEGNLKHD